MLEIIFRMILVILAVIGFIMTSFFCAFELVPKMKEFMNRQCKIRCLCRHEYVKKATWTHIEHAFSKDGVYREYDLQCRKCGKKKTINIYEEEVD